MENVSVNSSIKSQDFIRNWKERKKQNERESKQFALTPEFQEIKNRLRKKNAERGIIIPRV